MDSTRSKEKIEVHQWAQFITDTKLPHNQEVKRVLKYQKGTAMQGLIMKPDT